MMTSTPALAASASRVIPATPEQVYDMVADVESVGSRSPETLGATWVEGQGEVGSRFKGHNRMSFFRWSTMCTVTAADRGRRFAFDVAAPSSTSWSFEFEPVEGGTRLTQSMRKEEPPLMVLRLVYRLVGVRDHQEHLRRGIETTLENMEAAARAAAASPGS